MTLDDAIKHVEEVAEINQKVVDTRIVFDDVSIDMLFCDDTEVIEEQLAIYQKRADEHRQLAEWLKDYKRLLEQQTEFSIGYKYPEYGGFMVTESGLKDLPHCNCEAEIRGKENE